MKEQLNTVCDIAEQMLKSGAEVHRAEDSLSRMCLSIGAKRADVFITTNSMVITVYTADEKAYTQTRRVLSLDNDMERLHRLNALSRKICEGDMSLESMREEYERIISAPVFPLWVQVLAYGFICGGFAVFFGGGLLEGMIAFITGSLLRFVFLLSEKLSIGKIFSRFICSFLATAVAHITAHFGIVPTPDFIIIGVIMVLIPGVGLTNAIRDLFVGDSIAGILRFIEAILIALAIAAGNFLFVIICKGVLF